MLKYRLFDLLKNHSLHPSAKSCRLCVTAKALSIHGYEVPSIPLCYEAMNSIPQHSEEWRLEGTDGTDLSSTFDALNQNNIYHYEYLYIHMSYVYIYKIYIHSLHLTQAKTGASIDLFHKGSGYANRSFCINLFPQAGYSASTKHFS